MRERLLEALGREGGYSFPDVLRQLGVAEEDVVEKGGR